MLVSKLALTFADLLERGEHGLPLRLAQPLDNT